MGAWGDGIFQNDTALDYLGDLIHQLTKEIEEYFQGIFQGVIDFDDIQFKVLARVGVMLTLCEHLNVMPAKEEVIKRWKKEYLRLYDEKIDILSSERGYKIESEEHRKVIEETFASLARIWHRWEEM